MNMLGKLNHHRSAHLILEIPEIRLRFFLKFFEIFLFV
jgi:hypothetical protein